MRTDTVYKTVEKNISKCSANTYRIRVGKFNGYTSNRNDARLLKRTFLNRMK